jgi:hypothetical protein
VIDRETAPFRVGKIGSTMSKSEQTGNIFSELHALDQARKKISRLLVARDGRTAVCFSGQWRVAASCLAPG